MTERVCKRCGVVAPVSPMGVCVACIERGIAEDPRMAVTIERTAGLLDRVSPSGGAYLRKQAAMVVLFAFLGRLRGRAVRQQ